MRRIWEYMSVRAERALSVKELMIIAMIVIGGFHAFLLLFFSYFRIYPMAAVNVVSVSLYVFCYHKIKRGTSLLLVFNLTYIEIVLHAVIAVLLLGRDSGFSLYIIAMLPLGYYATYNFNRKKRRVNPMIYVVFAVVSFFVAQITSDFIEPMYSYGNQQVDRVIYLVNFILAVIAIVVCFSTLLTQIRTLENLRRHQNKKLDKLSKTDHLTGLMNRRSIEERYSQAELLKEDYAIIMGDIDDFKKVNDTYGHDIGDKVLKAVAKAFKKSVREEDMVCRWGGEEILVFLPKLSKKDTTAIAERVLKKIREIEIETADGSKLRVTATLGVAISAEACSFSDVMKKADDRLYNGKRNGKNCVVQKG